MNNPFEDLMYRAGLTAQGCWDSLDDYDKQAVHKFAELIVRECVPFVGDPTSVAVKEMMRHFGVEE